MIIDADLGNSNKQKRDIPERVGEPGIRRIRAKRKLQRIAKKIQRRHK
jgi:hypothetical protein